MNNTTRVDDDHGETSSTLDPKIWALADVRPKGRKVAARKRRSKPIRTTLRWKWLRVARQRRTKKTYGSLHTCSRDLGINRCKTQETESGGGDAKIQANANNNVEAKMDMNKLRVDCQVETFPTLILETSEVGPRFNVRPERWEVVSRKVKPEVDPDGSRYSHINSSKPYNHK